LIVPNTTVLTIPKHLARDTRPGAPPNGIIVTDNSNTPMHVYTVDLVTGTRTLLTSANVPYGSSANFPLDGSNNRLLVSFPPSGGGSAIAPLDLGTGMVGTAIIDSNTAFPFGQVTAMALDGPAGPTQRVLAGDNAGSLWTINTTTGSRGELTAMGNGPTLSVLDGIAVDTVGRQALTYGDRGGVIMVNLTNGNRTLISRPGERGSGPGFYPLWGKIAADFGTQVAYITTNSNTLMAVDLVSGDRVITAR
jgi:hypothetical protein